MKKEKCIKCINCRLIRTNACPIDYWSPTAAKYSDICELFKPKKEIIKHEKLNRKD